MVQEKDYQKQWDQKEEEWYSCIHGNRYKLKPDWNNNVNKRRTSFFPRSLRHNAFIENILQSKIIGKNKRTIKYDNLRRNNKDS